MKAWTDGWRYCVFAKVTEGMEIVNKIKEVIGSYGMHQDLPLDDVVITSTTIEE